MVFAREVPLDDFFFVLRFCFFFSKALSYRWILSDMSSEATVKA